MWNFKNDINLINVLKGSGYSHLDSVPGLVDEVIANSQTLSASLGIIEDFVLSRLYEKYTETDKSIIKDIVRHLLHYSCAVVILERTESGITVSNGHIGALNLKTKKDKLGRLEIAGGYYNGYKVGVVERIDEIDWENSGYDVFVLYRPIEYGPDLYPVLKYKSILFDAINEFRIKVRIYNEVENGFAPKAVIFMPQEPTETQTDSSRLIDSAFKRMLGPEGDALVVIEYPNELLKPDMRVLEKPALGTEYLQLKQEATENIKRFFHIPEVLYGSAIPGKLGQNNEMQGAVEYMEKYVAKPYLKIAEGVLTDLIKLKDLENGNFTDDTGNNS